VVSFLVVNYNGGAMLAECLESIRRQTYLKYEVIVVDNGSTDGSWDMPCFDATRWRLVRLDRNSGFSPANNTAFSESQGEFIALINNDVVLAPDWTTNMVKALTADPQAGSAACLLLQRHQPDRIDSAGCAYYPCGAVTVWSNHPKTDLDPASHRPFGAVASAALYRKDALERTGLFHDRYFAYYEDTDLAIRLALYGYTCAFAHDAIAVHHGSATGRRHSPFHVYHLRRNIEYLYWVDMVGSLAFRYLLPHLLYECVAFAGATMWGQTLPFLKAKASVVRDLRWILQERQNLRCRLSSSGGVREAKRRLRACMAPWWHVFTVRWTERRRVSV